MQLQKGAPSAHSKVPEHTLLLLTKGEKCYFIIHFCFKITIVRINENDQVTQSCFYRNKNLWSTNITQKQTV